MTHHVLRIILVPSIIVAWIASAPAQDARLTGDPTRSLFAVGPVFDAARAHFEKQRPLVWSLIDVVNKSEIDVERAEAMRLLGASRDPQAAEVLSRNTTFKAGSRRAVLSPVGSFPAALALVEIGSPAIPALYGRLARDVPDLEIKMIAFVINEIDGSELGAFRIRELIKRRGQTERQSANAERLLKFLETTDFRRTDDWPR
jgi:hypothetical protein